jgi:hypothetical protein
MFQNPLMKDEHVLIGGDLIFTLGDSKIWGLAAQLDPLADFFISNLEEARLLNIQPIKLTPTWRKM